MRMAFSSVGTFLKVCRPLFHSKNAGDQHCIGEFVRALILVYNLNPDNPDLRNNLSDFISTQVYHVPLPELLRRTEPVYSTMPSRNLLRMDLTSTRVTGQVPLTLLTVSGMKLEH